MVLLTSGVSLMARQLLMGRTAQFPPPGGGGAAGDGTTVALPAAVGAPCGALESSAPVVSPSLAEQPASSRALARPIAMLAWGWIRVGVMSVVVPLRSADGDAVGACSAVEVIKMLDGCLDLLRNGGGSPNVWTTSGARNRTPQRSASGETKEPRPLRTAVLSSLLCSGDRI